MKKSKLDFEPLTKIGVTEDQIQEVIEIRKHSKAMLTDRVIRSLAREFQKAAGKGWTVDQILDEWSYRSWRGFKADWIDVKTISHEEAIRQLQDKYNTPIEGKLE